MRLTATVLLLCFVSTNAGLVAQDETPKSEQKSDATKSVVGKTDEKKEPKVSAPPAKLDKAPAKFEVKFETTKGDIIIEVNRQWAPIGADHFYNLVKTGYYDGNRFFRVLPNFVVQWGISGNPTATTNWRKPIKDDPVVASNLKGYITYAKTGAPNSRTTQLFINLKDNQNLDGMAFAPFGKVTKGFDVLNKLYSRYGGRASNAQGTIKLQGEKFLAKNFPELDMIKKATIMPAKSDKKMGAPMDGDSKKAPMKP